MVIARRRRGCLAADTFESKKRKELVDDLPVPDTIADGLKAKMGF